ncbi:protein kinase domain-containing protein [Haloarcula amylovorans]|uniref:protein kinase domain-containing protein n=1 Tax=Haloarcula amylovorans TaxID=2562280 RepID=UPI0010768CA6|nr:hypothetical protein [Halomicroarcula amylolytica]
MFQDSDFKGESVRLPSQTVRLGESIGKGSEGEVYHVRGDDTSVVKVFWEDSRDRKADKIRAMVNNPLKNSTYVEGEVQSIIWPEAVVTDTGGEFLGYQMPYKDLDSAKNAFEYTLTELDWESSAPEHRYNVAHNLAVMVAAIHDEGHAIGDFNHDNILIDEDGFVTLIDCDAFHITDSNIAYPDDTYYPRYAPPERRGGDSLATVQEADRFCLGVHVFQFLMEGIHPYLAQGPKSVDGSMEDKLRGNKFPYVYSGYEPIDSAPDYSTLPKSIRELFKRCFSEVGKNHMPAGLDLEHDRPSPLHWMKAFETRTDSENDPDNQTAGRNPIWERWEIRETDAPNGRSTKKSDLWDEWEI